MIKNLNLVRMNLKYEYFYFLWYLFSGFECVFIRGGVTCCRRLDWMSGTKDIFSDWKKQKHIALLLLLTIIFSLTDSQVKSIKSINTRLLYDLFIIVLIFMILSCAIALCTSLTNYLTLLMKMCLGQISI